MDPLGMLLSAKKRKRPIKQEAPVKSEQDSNPSIVKDEDNEGPVRVKEETSSIMVENNVPIKEDPVKEEPVKDEQQTNDNSSRRKLSLGKNRPLKEHLKRLREAKAAEDAARARPIKEEEILIAEEEESQPQSIPQQQSRPKRRKFFSPKGSMPASSSSAQNRRASFPSHKPGMPMPSNLARAASADVSTTSQDSSLYKRREGSHKSIWNMAMDCRRDPNLLWQLIEARSENFINPSSKDTIACSCGSRDTQRMGNISNRNQDVRKGEIWGAKDREDMVRYRCNKCGKSWNVEE
jgi:hypothetical protein